MPTSAHAGRRRQPGARGPGPGLDRLRAAVARTTAGEPSVVLVGGEAGVGKSRLLEGAFGGSPGGVRVLTGGCIELGGEGLPLVPLVEDLHWADRTTLDLVAFLVRALSGTRVLLVLTYRSDEVDRRSPLRPLLSAWERLRGVERLQLEQFSRAEVAAQIGACGQATDLWPLTYAQFRLAEALCAVGDRTAATEPLRTAAVTCARLCAAPLLNDVQALARRARIDLDPVAGGADAVAHRLGLVEQN